MLLVAKVKVHDKLSHFESMYWSKTFSKTLIKASNPETIFANHMHVILRPMLSAF